MARKHQSVLTQRQEIYSEARLDGESKESARAKAGYKPSDNKTEARDVKEYIADRQGQLIEMSQIKRLDVLNMLKEAYDMAKTMAEPSTMVSSAKEIGKMLGFYEPETIKVELSHAQASIQRRLTIMTDEQLLALAEGKGHLIEGESHRVDH